MLKVSMLQKGFRSADGAWKQVVSIDDFQVAAGEQVALRGESGCGKSTFLQLLAGFQTADAGEVFIDGVGLHALKERERDRFRAERIGFVFQSCNLLQGCTVMENVLLGACFGKGANPVYARRLLKHVGLAEYPHCFPRQLSLGQQQRVAVARALAGRPRLVIADEPTASLDAVNSKLTINLMREVCRENDASLIIASHDEHLLAEFPRVLAFEHLGARQLLAS